MLDEAKNLHCRCKRYWKINFFKNFKGDRQQSSGYFKLGHNVEVGYYDQTQEDLNEDRTVLEEIHDTHRLYSSGGDTWIFRNVHV